MDEATAARMKAAMVAAIAAVVDSFTVVSPPTPPPVVPPVVPPPPPPVAPPIPPFIAISVTTDMGDVIPVAAANPTHWTVADGDWGVGSTWAGGNVPATGNRWAVQHQVHVDSVTADTLAGVVVPGGRIIFAEDGDLRVGTLQVLEGAEVFQNPGTWLTLGGYPLDAVTDPLQWLQGLLVFGRYKAAGTPKTSRLRLGTEPKAGDTKLVFATPVTGWLPGDTLVIADSEQKGPSARPDTLGAAYTPHTETRKVVAVAADGLSCTLDSPLAYAHPGCRNWDGSLCRLPHVGNLTRDCVIRSRTPGGVRGHVAFTGRAQLDLENVQFAGLGRTTYQLISAANVKGRYALHLHHLSNADLSLFTAGERFRVQDCAVSCMMTSPQWRWGITLHDSHYGRVAGNVVFNYGGAGVMLEQGNEADNLIAGNFVVGSDGVGGRADDRAKSDFGFEGAAIWVRGPFSLVIGNVGADCRFGGVYYPDTGAPANTFVCPTGPGTGKTVLRDASVTPLSFDGNEFYGGRMASGWVPWSIGTRGRTISVNAPLTVISDLCLWHCYDRPVYSYEVHHLEYRNLMVFGDWKGVVGGWARPGVSSSDYLQSDVTYTNANIQGCGNGLEFGVMSDGVQKVVDGFFANLTNIYTRHLWFTGVGSSIGPRVCEVRGATFQRLTQKVPQWDVLRDPAPGKNWGNDNPAQADTLTVTDYNGTPGDSFTVAYPEVLPSNRPFVSGGTQNLPPTGP